MKKQKKHLDFEINLIPCIDLLSVCICFLLLTAVWMHIGALDVKQAVGGQPAAETAKKPTLWVGFGATGELTLDVQDADLPAKMRKAVIAATDGRPNLSELDALVAQIKGIVPSLTTALLQPSAQTTYEDIIEVMDHCKQAGLGDLGVSPL